MTRIEKIGAAIVNAEAYRVTDDPTNKDIGELDRYLNVSNLERSGIHDARYLSIMLRTPDGRLYAGFTVIAGVDIAR